MDYKRQYDLLIEKARKRGKVEGYKERHHIIPKCMGGGNEKENLVELTAREHYVAHRLLYAHHGTRKLAVAWHSMCRGGNHHTGRIFTNRQYERARKAFSESQTKPPKVRTTSVRWSMEHREKLRLAQTGKVATEETRKAMSMAGKGRKFNEEHKRKIGLASKGRVCSEETRKKISEMKKLKFRERKLFKESLQNADIQG